MRARKQNNKLLFALLLLATCIALIHISYSMVWLRWGTVTLIKYEFMKDRNLVSKYISDNIQARFSEPLVELSKFDLGKNLRQAAELGTKYNEISAIYIGKVGDVQSIFLSGDIALYNNEVNRFTNEYGIKPGSMMVSDWSEEWRAISLPQKLGDNPYQFNLIRKGDDLRLIIVNPDNFRKLLPEIFSAENYFEKLYFTEDSPYTVKAKFYFYEPGANESFFEFGAQKEKGWEEPEKIESYFGWKLKIMIYPELEWWVDYLDIAEGFPWMVLFEFLIALLGIFILAFKGADLRRTKTLPESVEQ